MSKVAFESGNESSSQGQSRSQSDPFSQGSGNRGEQGSSSRGQGRSSSSQGPRYESRRPSKLSRPERRADVQVTREIIKAIRVTATKAAKVMEATKVTAIKIEVKTTHQGGRSSGSSNRERDEQGRFESDNDYNNSTRSRPFFILAPFTRETMIKAPTKAVQAVLLTAREVVRK